MKAHQPIMGPAIANPLADQSFYKSVRVFILEFAGVFANRANTSY